MVSRTQVLALLITFYGLVPLGGTASGQPASIMMIQNTTVRVAFDAGSGRFTLSHPHGERPFVTEGAFAGITGDAKRQPVADRRFGMGQEIVVTSAAGDQARIMVFPKLPFALIRCTLKNSGSTDLVLNRREVASFVVDLGLPASEIRTLGTGGLAAPDTSPGSYEWLAAADPHTRHGVVAGWVTHDRASGVLFPMLTDGKVHVQARGDYGRLLIPAGQSAETETLALGGFDDARLGLEAWANAVARQYDIKLPPQPVGFCTWYTEKHGGSSDETHLAEMAEFAGKNLKPFGFNFIQIDDGWQSGDSKGNGPHKNFTQFNPDGPYKSGMKQTADMIKAHGLTPGIWFMPFAGTYNDPWFEGHQDWFVKRDDGTPYTTDWGGTSLDMTNPQAREYLRSYVRTIASDWGFTYFKMDGLYTGIAVKQVYVNSGFREDELGDAHFANPAVTNVEAFRSGLKLVREAAGPGVFFLGCTAAQDMRSYGGVMGLVDAMRVGQDNGGNWRSWVDASPLCGSRNYFLNGRIWYNDPDPNYVRASIPLNEATTIASWSAISGELNSNSDWIPDLPSERLEILRRTMPAHGATARPVDLFEHDPPRIWTVADERHSMRRDVVALFNWADTETSFDVPVSSLGLPKATRYAAFDYWGDSFLPPIEDRVTATIPPHSCRILAVRPLLERPFLLSTSRHVTQGMIDVIREKWDQSAGTLGGRSDVVGGDPYELRIAVPNAENRWQAAEATVSAEDQAAGVTITFTQEAGGVRALIHSSTDRPVAWRVHFTSSPH